MKYRVTFRQRFDAKGNASDQPEKMVDAPEGVILDVTFEQRLEPPSLHVEEAMEEDDSFLAFGTSTWVFDVAEGKEQEFQDALIASELVMHVEPFEDVSVRAD